MTASRVEVRPVDDSPHGQQPPLTVAWFRSLISHARDWLTTPANRAVLWACVAAACVAAVIVEIVVDGVHDDAIFWVVTPLRLILVAGLGIVFWRGGISAFRNPVNIPVLGLVIAATLSVVISGGSWSAWRGMVTGVAVFYLCVGVQRILPRGAALLLAGVFAVAVVVTAWPAIGQTVSDTPTGHCRVPWNPGVESCDATGAWHRAVGTFTNPNLLAAFLLLVLPLAFFMASQIRSGYVRMVGLVCAAAGFVALVCTVSRSAPVAVLAAAAVYVVLRDYQRRRVLIGGYVGVALAAVACLAVVTGVLNMGVRSQVYAASIQIFLANPTGVGLDQAGTRLQEALPGLLDFGHAHNLWLHWLLETSVLGLLCWVAIPVLAYRYLARQAAAGDVLAPVLAAGLTGFLVNSLVDHAAATSRLDYALWLVLGLCTTTTAAATTHALTGRAAQDAVADPDALVDPDAVAGLGHGADSVVNLADEDDAAAGGDILVADAERELHHEDMAAASAGPVTDGLAVRKVSSVPGRAPASMPHPRTDSGLTRVVLSQPVRRSPAAPEQTDPTTAPQEPAHTGASAGVAAGDVAGSADGGPGRTVVIGTPTGQAAASQDQPGLSLPGGPPHLTGPPPWAATQQHQGDQPFVDPAAGQPGGITLDGSPGSSSADGTDGYSFEFAGQDDTTTGAHTSPPSSLWSAATKAASSMSATNRGGPAASSRTGRQARQPAQPHPTPTRATPTRSARRGHLPAEGAHSDGAHADVGHTDGGLPDHGSPAEASNQPQHSAVSANGALTMGAAVTPETRPAHRAGPEVTGAGETAHVADPAHETESPGPATEADQPVATPPGRGPSRRPRRRSSK